LGVNPRISQASFGVAVFRFKVAPGSPPLSRRPLRPHLGQSIPLDQLANNFSAQVTFRIVGAAKLFRSQT
jgi:hypothetical protein